jgi:hypothetical protein
MIDMMILSASRSNLLNETLKSFNEKMKYDGVIRKFLHEDVIDVNDTSNIKEIASKYCNDIIIDNPAIGHGKSMDKLLSMTNTKYVINWEDDWEMIQEINLTELIRLMDKYEEINQICFHKRILMKGKEFRGKFFHKKEMVYDNITLTTNVHWAFQPALWRKDFAIKHWIYNCGNNVAWDINNKMKDRYLNENIDADFIIKTFGTYFYDGIGKSESFVLKHLGEGNSRLR